jgi:rhodanese-related sulfurtransferase
MLRKGFYEDHLNLKGFFAGKFARPGVVPSPDKLYRLRQSDMLTVDLRSAEVFAQGFIPDSINVPDADSLGVFVDRPSIESQTVYLISDQKDAVLRAVHALEKPRIARVAGWFTSDIFAAWQQNFGRLPVIGDVSSDAPMGTQTIVVDVRSARTLSSACFAWTPNAIQVPFDQLQSSLSNLPFGMQITVASETRNHASLAASLIRRMGFQSVNTLRQGAVVAFERPSASARVA